MMQMTAIRPRNIPATIAENAVTKARANAHSAPANHQTRRISPVATTKLVLIHSSASKKAELISCGFWKSPQPPWMK